MTKPFDDTDWTLLRALSTDGRQTVRALARQVGLSEPAVRDRIQRFERENVITGYHAAVNAELVDAASTAFVALRFDAGDPAKAEVTTVLMAESCILEVHEVAGEDCYWLKLKVASMRALAEVLDRVRAIPAVRSTSTTIVLRTIFERQLLAGERPVPVVETPSAGHDES